MTTRRKGGRNPKADPATNCCMVRFNDSENAQMTPFYEQSGGASDSLCGDYIGFFAV